MKRRGKASNFLKQKSYVLVAVLMLAAAFGMTGVYYAEQNNEKAKQKLEAQIKEEERLAEERLAKLEEERETKRLEQIKLEEEKEAKRQEAQRLEEERQAQIAKEEAERLAKLEQEQAAQTQETTSPLAEIHFTKEEMGWPIQGNVLMGYSADGTIYFATLDQYKVNPALILQGNVGDPVLAVADGKISKIETMAETGLTVTIDMGDGYSAVYGQLKDVTWQPGDYVAAGATVGYIHTPTMYYTKEGPNLYFQMMKDGKSIDPTEFTVE